MAELIEINMDTLGGDISQMETALAELRKEVEGAYTSVRELDAMWNGPEHEAVHAAFQDDKNQLEELLGTMDNLVAYMKNARDEYRRCEQAVAAEIDSIRI